MTEKRQGTDQMGRRPNYRKAVLAVCCYLIVVVTLPALKGMIHCNKKGIQKDDHFYCIVEDGRPMNAHDVYERMDHNMMLHTDGELLSNRDGWGGRGFYKKGEMAYLYAVVCIDEDGWYLEYQQHRYPAKVIFYDYTDRKPRIEHMAYLVQALFENMSYEEAVQQLRLQYGDREDAADPGTKIRIQGTEFFVKTLTDKKGSMISVTWD